MYGDKCLLCEYVKAERDRSAGDQSRKPSPCRAWSEPGLRLSHSRKSRMTSDIYHNPIWRRCHRSWISVFHHLPSETASSSQRLVVPVIYKSFFDCSHPSLLSITTTKAFSLIRDIPHAHRHQSDSVCRHHHQHQLQRRHRKHVQIDIVNSSTTQKHYKSLHDHNKQRCLLSLISVPKSSVSVLPMSVLLCINTCTLL